MVTSLDTVQPRQLRLDLNHRVVAQIELVVHGRRVEKIATDIRMSGAFFLVVTPVCLMTSGIKGKARATRFWTITWARFKSTPSLKVIVKVVRAVVGALRRHVHHVLDAVDLLLDRRGHGLGDDLALAPG